MFSVTGALQMRDRLKRLAAQMPKETAAAARVEMEIEATEVRRRTPVDTGALVGSVHVDGPTIERGSIYAAIVAGGAAAPYAFYVHEDLEAFHGKGQAKYIESVIFESARFMAARIAARIDLRRAAKG